MPRRYNVNPLKKDFDLTEWETNPVGVVNWGQIGGNLPNQNDLQVALDAKVNDTGDTMTGNLNFTNASVTNANTVSFNTANTTAITEGVMGYNSATANLELGLAGGNTTVALGKELVLPRRVRNSSGTTMTKGTVVYISSVSGNTPVVSRAIATGDATSAFTIGVVAENINDGNTGWVLTNGLLAGINLASYTAGDTLYLSGTNAGEFTNVPQLAPKHYVRVGIVTKATTDGEMIVNIINGYELKEIHDVALSSVQTGQILQYQTDGLWKNVTLSGVITNHNSLNGIQGGTTNEYNHLTNLQVSNLNNQSGTNTGDVTVTDSSTIDFTLTGQALTGSVIQSGITHNNLGSLQGGTAGQYNHLTNSELAVVQATSGTNTGNVTVIDTRSVDLTVSGQVLQANVIPSAITHNSLSEFQGGTTGQYNHITNLQLQTLQATSGTNTGDITVQDTRSVDLTLSGQLLQANVLPSAITHNSLAELQGGTTGQFNHLTNTELSSVQTLGTTYLRTNLANTPLTGTTLNFNDTEDKNININRTTTAGTSGRALNITAGGAVSGGTNIAGGALKLSSGTATGSSSSDIEFLTATPGTSGTADRTPTTKMIVKGSGRVGIGTSNPTVQLQVVGNGNFTGDVSAANISGTNSGDQYMPVYGDGSDGYISLDGTSVYPNILSLAGSTYTLLRDIYCTTFNIVNGVTLETAGYRIFCITDCIVDGIIRNNGGNASGATAGTGATGGFFKAGTNGAAGLGTASAGANGTAVTNPTAATWVGGLGGRGGAARATNTTFLGSGFVPGNVTPPANSDGGPRITSNFTTYLNKLVSAATPYQFTPSAGGGAGAKSATGTSAVSGGGGGGGGVVFIASPNISTFGTGVIQANGGDGGNASGTGGTFGGGGGGGGGVAAIIAKNCTITPQVNGGIGGTSVRLGTNPDSPVGTNVVNTTTTSTSISVTPTVCPSEYSLMMLSVNIQKTGGVSNCYITGITGYAMNWTLVSGSRVEYNSIASPTRAIEVWSGQVASLSADLPADRTITITFSEAPTNARIFIDEIFNTDVIDNGYPVTSNYQTNRSDSATTLTMTLPTAPAAADGVFTFVGRSGGTVAASTTGTIMGTSDTNSAGATMLGLGTTTNTMTHTTAAAVAGFSVELNKPTISQTRGSYGWNGRYIRLYG